MKIKQHDTLTGNSKVIGEFDFECLGWYGTAAEQLRALRAGKTIVFNGYTFAKVAA